jgi:DNA-binding response OmpR family regulator
VTCACPTCGQPLPAESFSIDWDAGIIVAAGRFAQLTRQEMAVFTTLHSAKGGVRSKEQLLAAVTSFVDDEPEIKIVDVFVCKIRKKFAGLNLSIETVWGIGYRLLPNTGGNPA